MDAGAMEWQAPGQVRTPVRQAFVVCIAIVAGMLGLALMRHPLFALIGVATVLGSTLEVFFPVSYRLDQAGASSKCGPNMSAIKWADVKRLITDDAGVRLSPLTKPSRLDRFRGVELRYAGNEGEVLDKIRELCDSNEIVLGRGTERRAGG